MVWRCHIVLFVALPLLLVGADREKAPGARAARKLTPEEVRRFFEDRTGVIVTDWAEQDLDTRTWRSFTNAGYATVFSEGKLADGEMVFRKGFKHVDDQYPGAQRPAWYTYQAVSQDFLDRRTKELAKESYIIVQMQRFVDGDGESRYCVVWAKAAAPPKRP
jgi:hypothetical protein